MPGPAPRYAEGVPKDHCQVRCCNEEGEERPGQKAAFPYAHSTMATKGVVKRKPVFSHDMEHTISLLEPVFQNVCVGSDYERLSERRQKEFCKMLDKCDLDGVSYHDCQFFIDGLILLCSQITKECTGKNFNEWGFVGQAEDELRKAWLHFVRLIWIRDYEWENLVRCISDPNSRWSVNEDYFLEDPDKTVGYMVSHKLMVPLQVWSFILRSLAQAQATAPGSKRSYV
eukprot:TRINITY_DN51126_c0_g1_i1.p1 TRINITY_DN51126_c0_g1~~TRINITY_DN51126_c0_g1_i1.p1  ORF type:complete len:228 (+),score=44.49 TRINITY_DN51126_c0_g1_i1:66-749(+)